MCGIAGIFDNNSKKSSESLTKGLQMMLDAIKHRGPGNTFISTWESTYKSMLVQSWRQSQLQVEEPKSAIKHGGPGKTFISTWEFT